jgi:hypothetical protein
MQQAYEFQATAQNGFIRVLTEKIEEEERTPFPYFAVDTTGYVFDREEANAR